MFSLFAIILLGILGIIHAKQLSFSIFPKIHSHFGINIH